MRKKLGMFALLLAGAATTMLSKPALAQDGYYGGRNQSYQRDRVWDDRHNANGEADIGESGIGEAEVPKNGVRGNGVGTNGASTNGVNARDGTTSTIAVTILVLPFTSVLGAE